MNSNRWLIFFCIISYSDQFLNIISWSVEYLLLAYCYCSWFSFIVHDFPCLLVLFLILLTVVVLEFCCLHIVLLKKRRIIMVFILILLRYCCIRNNLLFCLCKNLFVREFFKVAHYLLFVFNIFYFLLVTYLVACYTHSLHLGVALIFCICAKTHN